MGLLREEDVLELSQGQIASAAGVAPSLFRRSFPTWHDLYGEIAAVAACLLAANIKDAKDLEDLAGRWISFQQAVPRQYEAIFAWGNAHHPKLHPHRTAIEQRVAAAIAPETTINAYALVPMAISILHGEASRRSPVPCVTDAARALRAYVASHG